MHLNCPDCKQDINASDIHLEKTIAKCSECHSVFKFDEELDLAVPVRPEIFLPKGMDIFELRSEVEIQITWRDTLKSFPLLFTIIWNAMVLPAAIFAIITARPMIILGLSFHLLVGIASLYYLLTTLYNTTFITADSRHLRIEHRPLILPFYPNQDIPVYEIDQIYVKKYVKSHTNGRPDYVFAVEAILIDKSHVRIVKGIQHSDQALYIEQEIERFLAIKDRPVKEEWEGR